MIHRIVIGSIRLIEATRCMCLGVYLCTNAYSMTRIVASIRAHIQLCRSDTGRDLLVLNWTCNMMQAYEDLKPLV